MPIIINKRFILHPPVRSNGKHDISSPKMYDSFTFPFLLGVKMLYLKHPKGTEVSPMASLWGLLMGNIPMLILMLVGVGLLVFEMYVPGFGAPGILGSVLLVLGFVLLKPTLAQGLLLFVILAAILCIALSICLYSASKGRLSKSKLMLNDVAIAPDAAENNDLNYFIGREGTAHTALRPAGIGEFDGVKLNVVSDGEFIRQGQSIRVQSVSGNRIVVRGIES